MLELQKIHDCLKGLQKIFLMRRCWIFKLYSFRNDKRISKIIAMFTSVIWLKKKPFLQNSSSLWQALTPKPFELQTWDWSRMKENLKIFKIISRKKHWKHSFHLIFLKNKKEGQFFYCRCNQLWHSWPPLLHLNAISKRLKLRQPARSHFEDLSQSFQTVMDFTMFFSL